MSGRSGYGEHFELSSAFRALLNASVDGQSLWAPMDDDSGRLIDLRCVYVNPVAAAVADRICGEMPGRTVSELAGSLGNEIVEDVLLTVARTGAAKRRRVAFPTADGELWIDLSVVRVGDGLGVTGRDVTKEVTLQRELAAASQELIRLANTDPLTGLANRRAWNEQLLAHLAAAGRTGRSLAVAILDLDRFKNFNDCYGHPAGDRLLQQVAAAWTRLMPEGSVLARLGGEEFAVALPDHDLGKGHDLVTRLCAATPGRQTASAGVTVWNGEEDATSLLGRADVALYAAKREGRDRVLDLAPFS